MHSGYLSRPWQYGIAVAAVLTALAGRAMLDPFLGDQQIYSLFFAAVTVAAWFGGYGPALLAIVMSYLSADWFFIDPRYSLKIIAPDVDHLVGLGSFLFAAAVIVWLTEAMRRTQRELEKNRQSVQFLADTGVALGALADHESTLQQVTSRSVPTLGDWCVVDLLVDGRLRRVAAAHVDRAREPLLAARVTAITNTALETGRTQRTSADSPYVRLSGLTGPNEQAGPRGQAGKPDVRSVMAVPILVRGATVAVATFGRDAGPEHGEADVALAEELARRTAVALDNARLYREVRDSDRHKDEFLALLAHEMRNPLAAISGATVLLGKPEGRQRIGWIGDVLARQTQHLVRMVDDLLDISRISRGKIQLKREPLELADIVYRVVEDVRPLVEQREHRLVVRVSKEAMPVLADPTRLSQILGNLLTNAVKYTDPGGRIVVSAHCEGRELVVRVRDTGVGIAPEMLRHVFQLYAQAGDARQRSQGGLGIGLALVKRLTEMHGGTVSVYSEGLGHGSEFVLRLPVHVPTAAIQRAGVPPVAEPSPRAGLRVLVVEDNRDAAQTLSLVLKQSGYEVATAYDGETALDMAREFRAEAILLDIGLPGMDGYETARRLRGLEGMADAALVAVSGYGQDDDRRRSQEAGFRLHLLKPVDVRRLLAFLAELATPSTEHSSSGRRIVVIDDNVLVAQLTAAVLRAEGHEVTVARDGPGGIEAARQVHPEAVLCDISLSGDMDGYGVARAIRSDPDLRRTRLLAVTGHDSEEHHRRALAAGFDDLLPKPLDLERLNQGLAYSVP